MNERFPLTLRARVFEPAHAAAARLAARWGATDPTSFSRRIGYPLSSLINGRAVSAFSQAAGLDTVDVEAHSPVVAGSTRTVLLCGQILRLGDWSMRTRRHCPVCLEEDQFSSRLIGLPPGWWASSRTWWDVRSIDVCLEHGVRMVDQCGACGKFQTWRSGLLNCRCGARHGMSSAVNADRSVAEYIMARLQYGPAKSIPVLDAMSLADAIRTMELLGAALLPWRLVKPVRAEQEVQSDRLHGLAIASGWPSTFQKILDTLVSARPASVPDGLIAAYGWLYSDLCVGAAPLAAANLVAPVLRDHAIAHGIIARDEERLGAVVAQTISATETARQIGRSYATTRRLLEEWQAVPDGSRRGVAFAIDPQVVERLTPTCLPSPESRLRVGRNQARAIMRDECISACLISEGRNASELVEALLDRAVTLPRRGLVPLPTACRNVSVPLAEACQAILSDRLAIARRGTADDGLRAVLVREHDLAHLRPAPEQLGVSAIARFGRIHPEAASFLVRAGAFGACVGTRVEKTSVSAFFSKHVTAAELARGIGTSSSGLSRTLADAGVRPRYGPPACRQLIYLRSEVSSAAI